jgi:ribosomal protein L16/L10AE
MDLPSFSDCVIRQCKRDKWKIVRMSSGKGAESTSSAHIAQDRAHAYIHISMHA